MILTLFIVNPFKPFMNRMFILSTSGTKPKTIHAVESKQNRKQSRALARRTKLAGG